MATATPEREIIRAQARYVRTSARKARLVLEHIRGKSALEAQTILAFHTRAAAKDANKVLKSAIANADNNNGYDAEDMVVVAAYADEGPTLKRWRPRARGRVNRIEKRTCHITIQLAVANPGEIKRRAPRAAATAPVAPTPEPVAPVEEETPVVEDVATEAPAAEAPAAEEAPKPKRKPRAKKPKVDEAAAAASAEEAAVAEPEAAPDAEAEVVNEADAQTESAPEPEVEAGEQPSDTNDEEASS